MSETPDWSGKQMLAAPRRKIMQKDWKEFEGGPNKSFRNRIRVTLSPKGMILLNRIAYQALEEPQA